MSDYGKFCLRVVVAAISLFFIGCAGSPESQYLGEWERVEESGLGETEDWAAVTMSGDSLFWENSDGKFPATLMEKDLMIDVDGFAALARYDGTTGILTFTVHGNSILYKRKK